MSVVLIVDDTPESLYLLRCLLTSEGFQVVEARNGQEALHATAVQRFALVISDILMPVMDGFNLCRAWKADDQLRMVPFVFYTAAYVDKRDEDFAMSLGADLFLIKPADPTFLLEQLRALMAKGSNGKAPDTAGDATDGQFLRQYNEVLIRKLEDKLQELEETNHALMIKDFALSSSTNGILLTRKDGEVTYANPAMLRMARRQGNQVVGHPVRTLFAVPALADQWLKSNEKNAPVELQLIAQRSSESGVWLSLEKTTVTDLHGAAIGLMLSCANVTEERRLRQELSRAQRLEALGLFAAGIAHDFNNLLMAIFSGLELDVSVAESGEEREENRAMALAAFHRARDLTRRLLTFSRHSAADKRSLDLRQLLDESIVLSLSGSGIRCEKRYCEGPAMATVDSGQMAQVFSNLLVNARQAMNDKGTLVVAISPTETALRSDDIPAQGIRISITDSGPGIPPDILPDIFEPYFTTKAEGTGLGLATSHAIVQEHGGSISVRSKLGAGTTFEVRIPAVTFPAPASGLKITGSLKAYAGHILVMDDQVAIQSLLQRGLEKVGYSVVVVGNGEQALLEFKGARAEGLAFDLFLLDLTIQGGMGAVETLAELRALDPDVLALATTGYADQRALDSLQKQGFSRVIAKPFLLHELYATIKAVLPQS